MKRAYILVVDDEPDIRRLVQEILEDEGYEVGTAENGAAAREKRRARRPDLILLDIWMPDVDGITLLKEWAGEDAFAAPVIMISGHGTVETAVEATRLGAYDFLEKPLSMAKLLLNVRRALEADQLRKENLGLRQHVATVSEPVGKSAVMQRLREQARRIAQHDSWLLIRGEPGSGKEVMARHIHALSARKEGPFVEVGVASIAHENASIELFGAEKEGKVHFGLLEQANGGTLFLDDISDMALTTQAPLLSALETQSFLRVGGAAPVRVNVRVIAATQRDLAQEAAAHRFREDLYYRLNVLTLAIPALREHGEDVPELLNYYVNWFVTHEGLPYRAFTVAAQNRLRHHPWPGNVRELKNLVQRVLILGSGAEITLEEVETALGAATTLPTAAGPATSEFDLPLREARERFEKAYLEYHLRKSGSMVKLAQLTGMERTHLYRKLKSLGINPKQESD